MLVMTPLLSRAAARLHLTMRKLVVAGRHSVGLLEASAEVRQVGEPPPECDLAHAAPRLGRIFQCLPTPFKPLRRIRRPMEVSCEARMVFAYRTLSPTALATQ